MIKLLIIYTTLKCSPTRIVNHSTEPFTFGDKLAYNRAIEVCASGRYGRENPCLTSFIKKKDGHLLALCGPYNFKHESI